MAYRDLGSLLFLSSDVPPAGPKRRAGLKRSTGLKRTPLKRRAKRKLQTAQEVEWKIAHAGFCQCCQRFSMRLEHHHIVELQTIRRENRDDLAWDPRNGIYLHPRCHSLHTAAIRRLPLDCLPDEALEFAIELGRDRACVYFAARYSVRREAAA